MVTGTLEEPVMTERFRRRAEDVLKRFCDGAVPAASRGSSRLTYRIEGAAAILYEARKVTDGKGGWRTRPAVRFRYDEAGRVWRHERLDDTGSWRAAIHTRPARKLRALLRAYSRTSREIFWG